jgi:hypothetical protein
MKVVWLGFASMVLLMGSISLSYAYNPNDGIVAVGGETLLVLRAPVGNMSIRQRVNAVQDRLVTILGAPKLGMADIVKVKLPDGEYKIDVHHELLVTVTKEDAAANKTTTSKLAGIWLEKLRKVLPEINARPNPNNRK